MKVLVLDDDVLRLKLFVDNLKDDDVTTVSTAKQAIDLLAEEDWDIVFLDHDLSDDESGSFGTGTGYEVAKWLSENPDRKPKQMIIHTMNPQGQERMKMKLPDAMVIPFSALFTEI